MTSNIISMNSSGTLEKQNELARALSMAAELFKTGTVDDKTTNQIYAYYEANVPEEIKSFIKGS